MTGPVLTFRVDVVAKNFISIILCEPINDTRLVDIVGRHLQFHTIADREADKAFAHFARNMREDEMFICQRDTKHCAGKNGHDYPFYFDGFF